MVYGGDAIPNIHALRLAVDSHLVNYNYHDQKKTYCKLFAFTCIHRDSEEC